MDDISYSRLFSVYTAVVSSMKYLENKDRAERDFFMERNFCV